MLTTTEHTSQRTDFTTAPYEPAPGMHRQEDGAPWCMNDDPHPAGRCFTPVGAMIRPDFDAIVMILDGVVNFMASWRDTDEPGSPIDPSDARLIAAWLVRAADLVEGRTA